MFHGRATDEKFRVQRGTYLTQDRDVALVYALRRSLTGSVYSVWLQATGLNVAETS